MITPSLTIGIEEEYQIIDPATRELRSYVQRFLEQGRTVLPDQMHSEFMQSQVAAHNADIGIARASATLSRRLASSWSVCGARSWNWPNARDCG